MVAPNVMMPVNNPIQIKDTKRFMAFCPSSLLSSGDFPASSSSILIIRRRPTHTVKIPLANETMNIKEEKFGLYFAKRPEAK